MPYGEWIPLFGLGYLSLLFAIAYYADRRADAGRSIIGNPIIYTLSLAVYCTAWTFYGSVGRAAGSGPGFLPIYIGPTLMAGLWWWVLRKMVRIAKTQRLTSIADFIGSRYGKSSLLAGLVTVIAVVGILPYISLQLKAVATSFCVLSQYPDLVMPGPVDASSLGQDSAFYLALILAAFTILFGARHLDATERHEGMVAAVAFESLFKLVAFLAVGFYVVWGLYDGVGDLYGQAAEVEQLAALMGMDQIPGGYGGWLSMTFLAMCAILFLPRQFQLSVVENVSESHVRTAMWLFPLYLLIINLFVLPIALGGRLAFPAEGVGVDPDTYMLTLPMAQQQQGLALLAFLGGLSAATGMVIVATIALSTMVCNDLVMPALLRIDALGLNRRRDLSGLLLAIRRTAIVLVLLLGYLYYRLIGESYALVTIGLVSFAAAAQFAPAIIIGMYWRGATRLAAIAALCGGFLVWAYTLFIPGLAQSGWLPISFINDGPFGIGLLRPYQLFGLEGLDRVTHSVFWSMLVNLGLLIGVSLYTRRSTIEKVQATLFVDAFRHPVGQGQTDFWGGVARVNDLYALVARFMGEGRARETFSNYARSRGGRFNLEADADRHCVGFVERLLAGAIGTASARVMVASVAEGESLNMDGVMAILDETTQIREYSRQLEQKSRQLESAGAELRAAYRRLQELDHLKDEFVSTVSHELRTPLTSIRAFSEMLLYNPALDQAKREEFVGVIVVESERLTRLINNVLDLSKVESGHMDWAKARLDLRLVVGDAVAAVGGLYEQSKVALEQHLPEARAEVEGDRDRLTQVVVNLLSNAAKFCTPGTGRVVVELEQDPEGWRVEVADNGPGIPEQHLDHVFAKFHQVNVGGGQRPKGTGLGLAISRQIVKHHGGRIWVRSRPGEGARFMFVIPAAG